MELTVDGTHDVLEGEVVAVAAAPDSSSTSSGFRVTIGFAEPDADVLRNGSTGSVTITTDGATAALTVPTSAVAVSDDRHTVTALLSDGTTRSVTVEVGVIGAERTQITSGLSEGDRVVLADLDEALPSSATESTTTGSSVERQGTNGGFPSPPSGFGGGPPGG